MALFLSRMIGVWTRRCGQGLRFRLLRSGARMLDAESVCGCGDVGKACVLAFCGSGAHVFVSDSEILKNTGHFNNEIDFAGSEVLICEVRGGCVVERTRADRAGNSVVHKLMDAMSSALKLRGAGLTPHFHAEFSSNGSCGGPPPVRS